MTERRTLSLKSGLQFHTLRASGTDVDGHDWFEMSTGQKLVVEDPDTAAAICVLLINHDNAHFGCDAGPNDIQKFVQQVTNNSLPDELATQH